MASPNTPNTELQSAVTATRSLLQKFEAALSHPTPPSPANVSSSSPLSILHDSATLTKAHTTKLSLLILNTPFTPSAINTILRDLSTTALPAMLLAVELTHPQAWTSVFHHEVKSRLRRLLRELRSLLAEIPLHPAQATSSSSSSGSSKDSLACTGVVWEACDALSKLREQGLAGVMVEKAEQYRAMLEDARDELDAWSTEEVGEEEDEDEDELGDGDAVEEALPLIQDDGIHSTDFDDIFAAANKLSSSDSAIREQLTQTLKYLAQTKLLYQAIIKRRLRHIPEPPSSPHGCTHIARLDSLMEALAAIPTETDELASAFYELDEESVKQRHRRCEELAFETVTFSALDWGDQEDHFSDWGRKWLAMTGTKEPIPTNKE